MWAWSDITTSSSCQPKAELVAKEARRHDCEVNSMVVNDVSHAFCVKCNTIMIDRIFYMLDVETTVYMYGTCRTNH